MEDVPEVSVVRQVKLRLGSEETILTDARGRRWLPETVAALLLVKPRRDAQNHGDKPIRGATLTVPAHFTDPQRRALWQAARLAGLLVLDLIEEPIAAAAHYGVHAAAPGSTFLVYALGGAVAEATVLRAGSSGLSVRASAGVSDLGGKDFDEAIVTLVAELSWATQRDDPRQDPTALAPLRRRAEALKRRLLAAGSTEVRTALLLGGRVLEVVLTRDNSSG